MSGFWKWLRAHGAALVIGTALAAVSAVTGFISYTHICALTLVLHQSWKTAHLMPVAVDGQIVIGSVVFMVIPGRNRFWGLVGIVPGLAESLFANWESGIADGRFAAAWATVAAQAFAVSSFLFERWLKSQAVTLGHAVRAVPAVTGPEPVAAALEPAAPDTGAAPEPLSPEAAFGVFVNSAPVRVIAEMTGVPKTRVGTWRKRLADGVQLVPDTSPDVQEEPHIRYAEPSLNGAGAGA